MWLKLTNLLSLLLAVVWLSRAPGWEPAIVAIGLLMGLIAQEWRTARRSKHPPQPHLRHDQELFRRYDSILPERTLKAELDGDLYSGSSSTRFTRRLYEFVELARSEEGRFLLEAIEVRFSQFAANAKTLQDFIAHHFFTFKPPEPRDPDGHERIWLYPEFRHRPYEPGRPDWNARKEELDALCEEVVAAFNAYRQSVREHLAI